jgi:hypothetical protein
MPRPVSALLRSATYGEETPEVFLQLLRIYHASIIGGPLRLVNNPTSIVSNGEEYIGCPFNIDVAADRDDVLPEVQLAVDNVDRLIVATLRTITTPIEVEMEVVVASTPDVIEMQAQRSTMRVATWDIHTVNGTLKFEDMLNEPYPGGTFTAKKYPGLF